MSSIQEHYLKALFSLVAGQQLSEACKLAREKRDHKLALLLSQATKNTILSRYVGHIVSVGHMVITCSPGQMGAVLTSAFSPSQSVHSQAAGGLEGTESGQTC